MTFYSSKSIQRSSLVSWMVVKLSIPVTLFALIFAAVPAFAQQPSALPDAPLPVADEPPVTLRATPRNLVRDQAAIWTSPLRLRDSNAAGPVLLVLATAVAITADHQAMSSVVSHDTKLNNRADTASQGLTGGFVAAPAAFYALGRLRHNGHAAETGILGGEAILDSLAVNEAAKIVSRRERPAVDGAKGKFFQSGVDFDSSFPSSHSIVAWSSAAVVATEYPGILTRITAYGFATGVSFSRVLAQQHFPSDVLVGSAIGWMIGRYVVHKHRREWVP